MDNDRSSIRRATDFGNIDRLPTGQKLSRHTAFGLQDIIDGSLSHDLATQNAGARPEVHHVISGPHGLFVVFDHNHRVALVSQTLKALQQHGVVARMKADRRFVQNVDNTDEATSNLSRETNALRFTAGQSRS